MSPPSIFTGNDVSTQVSSKVFTPVRQSYSQACHGHTRLPSTRLPSPSGPPACGQIPSKARNSPAALQIAYVFPSTMTSMTESGGSDAASAALMKGILFELAHQLLHCRVELRIAARVRFADRTRYRDIHRT